MKNRSILLMFVSTVIVSAVWSIGKLESASPGGLPDQSAGSLHSEFPASPSAEGLTLTVIDPAGDSTLPIDVVQMDMLFNKTTGEYRIVLTTDPAGPFLGDFRININLFNPDVGTNAPDPSFFNDVLNDYNLITPTLQITLDGTNPFLQAWDAGDRVFTNSLGAGNPIGVTFFRSGVVNFSIGEDTIAFADLAQPAIIQSQSPTDVALTSFAGNSTTVGVRFWLFVLVALFLSMGSTLGLLNLGLVKRQCQRLIGTWRARSGAANRM